MRQGLDTDDRSTLLELVQHVIRVGVTGEQMKVRAGDYSGALQQQGAAFVTVEVGGAFRGCTGELKPFRPLVESVAHHAFSAAFRDSRAPAVTEAELDSLEIHISVLSPQEALHVTTDEELIAALKPGVDGLVLREGSQTATFLPQVWDSLPNPQDFISHLKRKAGWAGDRPLAGITAFRYTVESVSADSP